MKMFTQLLLIVLTQAALLQGMGQSNSGGKQCFLSPTIPDIANAKSVWTFNNNGTITIRTTFAKTFVDNTYGTTAVGWGTKGHKFADLVGSDHLQLALYDAGGGKKSEFSMDYITADKTVSSGYKCLGVTGGEGKMLLGSSSDIVNVTTSLDQNLNTYNYVLVTNSPSTTATYTPNSTYPNWIYDVWYEVTIKQSVFGANGFGYPMITEVHASPSKTGNNSETVVPGPCPGPLTLGNLVWNDANKNGMKDGNEIGIGGLKVNLYKDVNGDNSPDGAPVTTTTTSSDGTYLFKNLEAGNYIAGVVLTSAFDVAPTTSSSSNPDNDTDNDNNGVNAATNEIRSNKITLSANGEPTNDGDNDNNTNLSLDFGLVNNGNTPDCAEQDMISSDFNGTAIAGGNYIWFNSHLKVSGLTTSPTTLTLVDGVISFTANGNDYTLPVPKTEIVFSNSTTTASTTYNTTTQTWTVQVPYKTGGDIFAGGLAFPVPSSGFPGGVKPVKWTANFAGSAAGIKVSWQWSAAVYKTFSTDYNTLGVLTVDGGGQAGSPENFKSYVTGGARGGGGSNTTGSNSGTGSVTAGNCITPCVTCTSCVLGYPDNSNLPRSAVPFNESEVLQAAELDTSAGANNAVIKAWYGDERALTLGVRRVIVKSASGTTTTDYPITPTPSSPTCVSNPLVGSTVASGDQAPNDVAAGGGRPLFPALFVTDLTVNGMDSRVGDWQQGGTPIPPSRVCGTWKGAVRTVDNTKSPAVITVTPDADPAKNNLNLGGGSLPKGGLKDEGFSAEIFWNISELGLIPGHMYRYQFMVHDGDQNKTGGDAGQSVFCSVMPGKPGLRLGNQVWNDFDGDGKRDPNEPGIPGATVSLYTDNDANNMPDGPAIKTTVTDAKGNYLFTDLAPGRYIASMPILPGYQQSPNNSTQLTSPYPDKDIDNDNNLVRLVGPNGVGGIVYSNAITLSFEMEPTNDGDDANGNMTFDLAECGNSFIGDFVWKDVNGNGIQDAGEHGINGVLVTITFSDGTVATTVTDKYEAANNANAPEYDGYYNFKNLGPGTYKISFEAPAGLYPSPAKKGSNTAKDSDPVNGAPVTVTIAANESDFTVDAGFTGVQNCPPPPPCPNLSIGNMVFFDYKQDGTRDEKDGKDMGIGGITVNLYNDANGDNVADGAAINSVVTAADGSYFFGNLDAGKYIVGVTPTAGYAMSTVGSTNPDNNIDDDNNGVRLVGNEIQSNFITLAAGTEPTTDGSDNNSNSTLDFGLMKAKNKPKARNIIDVEAKSEATMTVFPNPARNFFELSFDTDKESPAVIKVMDGTGKLVLTQNAKVVNGTNTIEFNQLNKFKSGVYIIQLVADGQTWNQKLVIIK